MSMSSSQDAQRPAPRPVPASLSRSHSRSSSQTFSTPRSQPSVPLTDPGASIFQSLGPLEPPAKRQKLESKIGLADSPTDRIGSPIDAKRDGKTSGPPSATIASPTAFKLPPFPQRPSRPPPKYRSSEPKSQQAPKREEVPTRPYALEAPKSAPQFLGGVTADFCPWRGNHPEDVLNDQTIKSGYFDNKPVAQNETGSARPMIWASVRHKSGLQILSSLFATTLEQRQAAGAIVARSTFKPPPRVTLTDAKRESWLRDLADASIPLRRLSRSIPHGIRGKALLDHCLAKKIPAWRAVWLAKCVGANEIRAFKRKGTTGAFATGGENKWIRDWTTNVQQFIEGLVEACGTENWKDKITYGLQLVAHVYSDQLLDQDFFLEWVISTLQTANDDHLPIWLLISKMFWKDMVKFRRRGRLLAIALSEQYLKTHTAGVVDANKTLWQKLSALMKSFITSSPSCFLLPKHWPKYESVLRLCDDQDDMLFTARLDRLTHRNAQLARPDQASSKDTKTPRQRLILILDSSRSGYEFSALSQKCLEAAESPDMAVRTVVQWATTPFRTGHARLYLAVRLLRSWSRSGVDLDRPIMSLLANHSSLSALHPSSMHVLLAELVRSRHFSLGKYLQWMMARGSSAVSHGQDARSFEVGLLHSIPLNGLPDHVLNLRQIVLSTVGDSKGPGTTDFEKAKAFCASQVPLLAPGSIPLAASTTEFALGDCDRSVKLEISRWIRKSVAAYVSSNDEDVESDEDESGSKRVVLSSQDFQAICAIFESLEDLPILADLHRMFVENCDFTLLSEIADSINCNFDCFYAFGAATDLFSKLLARLEDVPGRGAVERPLFAALVELARRFPDLQKTIARLSQELASCEPTSAIAMCSPVSDQMAEALQNADSSFLEEVEILFNSGTSMDQPVLSRVFADIMKRLEQAWSETAPMISYIEILEKLRAFSPAEYDTLMSKWLRKTLGSSRRPPLSVIMIPMVCGGIATVKGIFASSGPLLGNVYSGGKALAIEVLDLVTSNRALAELKALPRAYRFEQSRKELLVTAPQLLGPVVRAVIEACSCGNPALEQKATALVSSPGFTEVLLDSFASSDVSSSCGLDQAFPSDEKASSPVSTAVDLALGVPPTLRTCHDSIKALLTIADDFNYRLCQLRLACLAKSPEMQHEGSADFAEALVHEIASSVDHSDGTWRLLISELPPTVRFKALKYSTSTLLQKLTQDLTGSASEEDETPIFFAIVNALEPHVPPEECASLLEPLVSALGQLQTTLETPSPPANISDGFAAHDPEARQQHLQHACTHLEHLLNLLVIFQRLLEHGSPSTQTRLVVSLGQLLAAHPSPLPPPLASRVFDMLALISDVLAPETRLHAAQLLLAPHERPDPRLAFVLGAPTDPDTRLALAVPESAADALSTPHERFGTADAMQLTTPTTPAALSHAASTLGDSGGVRLVPFPLRRWELVQDATPVVGDNDAALSLTLFGARRAVL